MHNNFFYQLFHTKLATKIWLSLTLMVLSLFLVIVLLLELFFRQYVIEDALNACNRNIRHSASTFSSEYNNIINRFILHTASADFYDILKKVESPASDRYLGMDLQEHLFQYADISQLILSAVITTSDDSIFHSYKYKIKDTTVPYTFSYDFTDSAPISFHQTTDSQLKNQGSVIAMTFLLKMTTSDRMVLLADDINDAELILYFFFNTQKVQEYLDFYYNSNTDSLLYLADIDGQPISCSNSDTSYQTLSPDQIRESIHSAAANQTDYVLVDDNYILVQTIENSDLVLVNIISKHELASKIRNWDLYLFYIVLSTFLLTLFLGLLISKYVTNPLKILVASVRDIENSTYRGLPAIATDDEIGQLSLSIDSMYKTIQKQFVMIKKEEAEKFKMEIRLLSEQINPHFLYNTLECINMEIYNRHNETASNMISNLGGYLRISLSYGSSRLKISQELEHVKAYVNIMNFRFHQSIRLTTNVDQALMQMQILKSILQPLVENAIKHGFSIDSSNYFPISPCIDISISREPELLLITVTDNGAGIDLLRAEQIMKGEGKYENENRHVGLNNIYHRLYSFYGNVDIGFSSIPFFENKILIQIPYENFRNTQETPPNS